MKTLLAFIGALSLVISGSFIFISKPWVSERGDLTEMQRFTSPDNQHDAVFYRLIGGGAAGYCYHNVVILKQGEPMIYDDDKAHVFRVNCYVELASWWVSESELLISYSSDSEQSFTLFAKPYDEKTNISVRYQHR